MSKVKGIKRKAKTAQKREGQTRTKQHLVIRSKEVVLVIIGAAALFVLLALATYHKTDPGWSFQSAAPVQNAAGRAGAYIADVVLSFLGFFGYLLPFLMAYGVWVIYREPRREKSEPISLTILVFRVFGGLLTFFAGSGLSALVFKHLTQELPQGPGGIIGNIALNTSMSFLNYYGSLLVLIALVLIGFTLYGGLSWISALGQLFKGLGVIGLSLGLKVKQAFANFKESREKAAAERATQKAFSRSEPKAAMAAPEKKPKLTLKEALKQAPKADFDIVKPPKVDVAPKETSAKKTVKTSSMVKSGKLPSVDLLDLADDKPQELSDDALQHMARLTEEKLADFGVAAKVVGACPGPVITRFELQLAPGVKVSKLSNLSKDLARSLSAHSVRVVEVIPGKSVVGLEIPNDTRQTVRLREVLDSKVYRDHPSTLAMGLGLDISGSPELADLQKMPHLLVAGTTGSGKSVGLNAMLISLLLRAKPDELRMIMIDPKMLELSVYEGIPHLLTPVVTDMKEAANALRWCVKEMDQRYQLLAALGVRNIKGYNDKIKAAQKSGSPIMNPLIKEGEGEPEALQSMPYIVVLVDEFADMIMVVGKKVEELITRIAQKARAAGIHLILATQRPSVDVITGLIKANVPSRIAFQVSSKIDSRTILDQAGAEQLLGYGDMLYLPPGSGHPTRVHGAFVADHEVHAVVEAWRAQGEPDYQTEILQTLSSDDEALGDNAGGEKDELYDEAVRIVVETQRASISAVQRRLRIGYNRAARLIEDMEAAGLVSEVMPNGMREVLVKQ